MKTILGILMVFLLPVSGIAAGSASGTVGAVSIKETGYVLITFDTLPANPVGCEGNENIEYQMVAIANDHVAKQEILSLVLTAHTTREPIDFWVSGCYEAYGKSFPLATSATLRQ